MTSPESKTPSKDSSEIKPKVSILPDGRLATLPEGNEAFFAQQEQRRQEAIGNRHLSPTDRGEFYGRERTGEMHISEEQKVDIVAAELEERLLGNPEDESIKQMLNFIRSLHPGSSKVEGLSAYGLGHKKLEAVREELATRPMLPEDKQKLQEEADSMEKALEYWGDRLLRIDGEQVDAGHDAAKAQEGIDDHMTATRVRNATNAAAIRILGEHNQRVVKNQARKAS